MKSLNNSTLNDRDKEKEIGNKVWTKNENENDNDIWAWEWKWKWASISHTNSVVAIIKSSLQ